jgi:L-fucose mutarotase
MLRDLDPLLTPELLYVLAAMGHGDEIAVCDANFPAESLALATPHGSVVRLVGADAPAAARAILSLLPLNEFVDAPATRMEVVGAPDELPDVQREVQEAVDRAAGRSLPMASLERHAFYDAARRAYALVATGERRFYGNFVFTKGVVGPEDV